MAIRVTSTRTVEIGRRRVRYKRGKTYDAASEPAMPEAVQARARAEGWGLDARDFGDAPENKDLGAAPENKGIEFDDASLPERSIIHWDDDPPDAA